MKKLNSALSVIILFFITSAIISQSAFARREKQIVRVAANINNVLSVDDDGTVHGSCAEYLNEIANINNWKLEYVKCTWAQAVKELEEGNIDLLFPIQITDERKNTMLFSDANIGYQQVGLYASAEGAVNYEDYDAFDGKRIAVSVNSSNESALKEYAEENDFSYIPVDIDSSEDKITALQNGTVDLIAFSVFNDIPSGKIVAVIDSMPFYFATGKNNTKLKNQIDRSMQKMILENDDIVMDMNNNINRSEKNIALTKEENEYIKNKIPIKIGYYKNTMPLSDIDNKQKATGIYIDFLKELKDKTGLNIQPFAIDRNTYAYDLLDNGTIDFIMGSSSVAVEAEGSNDYVETDSFLNYSTVAVTKQKFKFDNDKPLKFALTNARKYWENYILDKYPNAKFKYFNNVKDCIDNVENNNADIVLLNTLEYNYQSKNPRYSNLIEWESFKMSSKSIMVATKKASPELISVINKGINIVYEDDIDKFVFNNLNTPYHSSNFKDILYNLRIVLIVLVLLAAIISTLILMQNRMHKQTVTILENKNLQLKRASNAKTEFLSRMSHDIRTPMNAIINLTSLVKEEIDDRDAALEDLKKIEISNEFLLALINDVLDMSKIEEDKFELHPEIYSYSEFLTYIESTFSPLCKKKNIELIIDKGENSSDIIIDKIRFNQICFNLLSNAVKFTKPGGRVEFKMVHGEIKNNLLPCDIYVSDNGIGMSEEFKKHMFDPFNQEDREYETVQGTGLGLTIVKTIVNLMDGSISVESEINKGTTVHVHINMEIANKINESVKDNKKTDHDVLKGKTILVAEDHPLNQQIAIRLLKKKGIISEIANNGIEAVKLFEKNRNKYSAVLMDLRMPLMTGFEATKKIRGLEFEYAKQVPIIAMTANAFDDDIRECLEVGMNAHIAKPIKPELLYDTLVEHIKNNYSAEGKQ